MANVSVHGSQGFIDQGLTRQTVDGMTLDVFDRPPFTRKGGDPFRSSLLRRFFYVVPPQGDDGYGQWAWVDARGRLVVGVDPIGQLRQVLHDGVPPTEEYRKSIADAMDFIERHHRVYVVPHSYEGVIFWREHGRSPIMPWAYVNSAQDLSHLL